MKLSLVTSLASASFAALVLASASGCGSAASEDDAATAQDLGQTVNVPNPSGAYFASINALGSGCPTGSWDAAIRPDGQAFTVTFASYEATVNPGQSFAIKDCNVAINLQSPQGFSFSVSDFTYQGYTILDSAGVTASQTAKYYFSGNPVPAKELRSDMQGPYNDSYVFSDEIAVMDQVWSPSARHGRPARPT